jgi:hypothetical protein
MAVWSRLQMTIQNWVLVIIFIFTFTGVYLKCASVSQQLIAPILSDLYLSTSSSRGGLVLKYRSLKMGAVICQQKYLTLIFFLLVCRLGRAPWETWTASGWRGYVWALKKNGAFRDSAQARLQQEYIWRNTHLHISLYYVNTFTFIYMNYQNCRFMPDNIVAKCR